MRIIKPIMILTLLFCINRGYAQLSTNEQPISFDTNKVPATNRVIQTVVMPNLDMAKIEAEDKEDEELDMPPRFGYSHFVNYNLSNSGTWQVLPNGDKLWQLNIVCPGALSVNLGYDKFWIPEGGKLFVYSKDRKHSIGAFTSRNNKGDSLNVRGFATGLIYGSNVVLEYYQPKEVSTDAIISIECVVHGYRYVNFVLNSRDNSSDCMVNVNCEEGLDWQYEKKAVAVVVLNYNRLCTGSLINTTDLNQKPYFLTANHCIKGYNAETKPNIDICHFGWNIERTGCTNNINASYHFTCGATVIANSAYPDFALLRLLEDPQDLTDYSPSYLGWDCSGQSGEPGVCIHHPKGDPKKISTVDTIPPISSPYLSYASSNSSNHWRVMWKLTPNGHSTVENGSSGAPLFNADHKVIGQLHGGYADCDNLSEPSWFGKFSYSWTNNNDSSIYTRLNCWLDSINSGIQTMEGLVVIPDTITLTTNQQLYNNIRITGTGQLIIQSSIEMIGNSRLIVEAGGQLIIDGGTISNIELDLKVGALLRIINGGVLDTRSGFSHPVGATVDILNGQIL